MKNILFLFFLIITSCKPHHFHEHHSEGVFAKNKNLSEGELENFDKTLPYRQIPDAPADFTSGNVIARMVDGLGYRYYWATEGLGPKDLEYTPSEKGRSTYETIEHIFSLSKTLLNGVQNKPNIRPSEKQTLTFEFMRKQTLLNLKTASDQLRGKTESDIAELKIIFQRGENSSEFPFWNMLNGPIADAMWHTGQIVMMRRAAGNPLPKGVNVFIGKTKE